MAAFTALFGALASAMAPVATTAATTAAAAAVPAATLGSVAPAVAAGTTAATAAETAAIAASTTGATGGAIGAMGTGGFLGEAGVGAASGAVTETAAATGGGGGTIFSAGNLARGASTLVSQGMQYKNQMSAQAAQEKAQEAQGKMASLRARNARLDALSVARQNIGNIQASAGAMGAGGQTSSLRGGEAGQQTGLAKQWGESRSLEGLAATAGTQMQRARDFTSQAAGWQMAGNLVNKTIAPTIFQTTKNPTANLSTNTIDW